MEDRLNIPPEQRRRMVQVARTFRKEATLSEALLWRALRHRKLEGRKFRRQHRVGPFVVDFFCHEERLVVEVDGPIHKHLFAADRERQELLEAAGLRLIRVSSDDVEADIEAVLSRIRMEFDPHPQPLSRARERGDRRSG